MKGDNKYKKGRVDGRSDTKEGKKRLAELIAEMKTVEAFEKNEQLNSVSDRSASPTIILDDSSTLSNSDIPSPFLQMPRPIRYSQLSHPPENLSQSITPNLPLPGTLEYYLASIPTTSQRITPEPEDLANAIPYAPLLFFANDEETFFSENLPLLPDKDKGKDPIRPWELVADDIIEALELPSVSPTKRSIKRAKRRSIIHITAASSRPQRGIKPTT